MLPVLQELNQKGFCQTVAVLTAKCSEVPVAVSLTQVLHGIYSFWKVMRSSFLGGFLRDAE